MSQTSSERKFDNLDQATLEIPEPNNSQNS